jgi:anti-sigma B factor antagonist
MSMTTFRKLNVSKVRDVDVVIFKDSKILDEELLDELRTELLAVVGQRTAPDVLLDFSNVEFMSSAMLGLLGVVHRKMKKADGRLKMCSLRPEIFTVFKLTNLDKLFSIYGDAGEAMKAFE